MKRVLIIAYYWPPSGGGGVQRWLKFTKYLPENGWQPIVYVPEGAAYPLTDPQLEADVLPTTTVWRGRIVEPAAWLERLKGGSPHERLGSSSGGTSGGGATWMRWVRGNVFIPDSRMLWIRPSVRRLKKELARCPVDAMVSTGPPHSTHLIALGVKNAFPDLPWVADFRDPWSDMDYLDDFHLSARSRAKHKALEQRVVSAADRIVVTAPSAANSLLGRPLMPDDAKAVWIPNGYDAADGFNTVQPPSDGPLVLGFFGALYGSRNAPGLWQAVRDYNEQPGVARPIKFRFYGTVDPGIEAELSEVLPISAWERCGSIPHDAVPEAMARCHGLVMVQNNNDTGKRTIPGKAFEYLASQRPLVVAGALDSDLERLVQSWGSEMCGMDDVQGFSRQLQRVVAGVTATADPSAYRRDVLAASYAALLTSLASAGSPMQPPAPRSSRTT